VKGGESEALAIIARIAPSVPLITSGIVIISGHHVIMLPLDRGKGCQGVGNDFAVGHLGADHRSRFVWYALVYRVLSSSKRRGVPVQQLPPAGCQRSDLPGRMPDQHHQRNPDRRSALLPFQQRGRGIGLSGRFLSCC